MVLEVVGSILTVHLLLSRGVIGNTSRFGREERRFEPCRDNYNILTWSNWLGCQPVTLVIAGSSPVVSAKRE